MHFLLLSMAGFLLSGLVGSCNGGLLATSMPDRMRGAAGGWLNVGNLASAALGAEITIKLMQSYGPRGASLSLLLLMSLPSLMALTIDEPRRPTRTQFGVLRPMLAELWRTARSRPGWTGILFCLSPVGTVALMSYFSALGKDYGVTAETVARVNGSLGAICTGLGSLAGGYICDRINRRVGYLAAAGLTAVCALVFAAAPLVPFAYVGGVLVYSVVAGLSYAAFSAVVLEIIGDAGASASTQYTLFTAAGNLAIAYTGFIDTRFHEAHGPRGLYVADAALNLLGIAVLSLMLRYVLQRKPAAPQAAAHPSAS
jgi:MFS family permease